eukprot:6818973-Heterocapsa_arctica.AAC.1
MLFEYCCSPTSLLTAWWREQGLKAERLTVPDNNLSTMAVARRLVLALRERSRKELRSLV